MLLFCEYHEVVVEVLRDVVERLEAVFEKAPMLGKVLREALRGLTVEVAVEVAPVVTELVFVGVEALHASLEVMAAVKIDKSDSRASKTPMRITEAILDHLLEVQLRPVQQGR